MLNESSSNLTGVWRPVQYLGNKQRVLPAILDTVADLVGSAPSDVVDAFSGSSVVTQALALRGHRVRSIDASPAAALLVRAVAGKPPEASTDRLITVMQDLRSEVNETFHRLSTPWNIYLREEDNLLAAQDSSALVQQAANLPQLWRQEISTSASVRNVLLEREHAIASGHMYPSGLLSAVFAGTYFSLRQALVLESNLVAGHAAWIRGDLTDWQFDSYRACILHSASKVVYSAGKHFAQPHRVHLEKSLSFHYKRLLQDRSIDAQAAIDIGAISLTNVAAAIKNPATSFCEPAETSSVAYKGASIVYADPPYTAQQYSRFYHVLDLIAEGKAQNLQAGRRPGQTHTTGLYPENRYLSDFCRSSTAATALYKVVRQARDAGAHLVLSYSESPVSTGNARIIPLETLVGVVESVYDANVAVEQVPLSYRSFNNRKIATSPDRELLVVARAS